MSRASLLDIIALRHFGKRLSWAPLNARRTVLATSVADRSWVVKLARPDADAAISKEAAMLKVLRDTSLPVPELKAVERCDEFDVSYLITEGIRGLPLGHMIAPGPVLFRNMGNLLAMTHQIPVTSAIASLLGGDGNGVTEYWEESLERAQMLSDEKIVQKASFQTLCETPMADCAGNSVCHSDFSPSQCIAAGSEIVAIVDWEATWIGNPMVDVQIAVGYLELSQKPERLAAFLEGYRAQSEIRYHDLPEIGMIFCINFIFSLYTQGDRAWQHAVRNGTVSAASNLFDRYAARVMEKTKAT